MILPHKQLGQHFLTDENVARKIVTILDAKKDDVVLEIGPGSGSLTRHLVETGATVIAVEIDARAVEALHERFGSRLSVITGDFLEADLSRIAGRFGKKLRVVGNIPYYITSDILFRLFENHAHIDSALLMMQLEVAQRLIAQPHSKSYGILTVATHFYSEPKLQFRVSHNSFHPKPRVDSAVVDLRFKETLPVCDRSMFHAILRSTFGQRRKILKNGLRSLGFSETQLSGAPVDLGDRPENLTVEQFVQLTRALERHRDAVLSPFLPASA